MPELGKSGSVGGRGRKLPWPTRPLSGSSQVLARLPLYDTTGDRDLTPCPALPREGNLPLQQDQSGGRYLTLTERRPRCPILARQAIRIVSESLGSRGDPQARR